MDTIFLVVYLAGVAIGLLTMRDRWRSRLTVVLVWPLGPMAFVVVTTMLVLAAAVLWPVRVIGAAALLGLTTWLLS
jgi:hypothetical protein